MAKYIRIILFLLITTVVPHPAYASCSFSNGEFLEELKNPENIKNISIKISNSKKWTENSLKIILSGNSGLINDKLRDDLSAKILVNYKFGQCLFKGEVRQSGDYLDHIKLGPNGNILASLSVKLKKGNILNSINFKLLLPKTRNNKQEVFGALLFRHLGYISPETFLVNAEINEAKGIFLFQENSKKELLERNLRREGPLFEGDEKLLWSYKNYKPFLLESLSLSRLENDNWAKKGNTSAHIAMNSFIKLQLSYLDYANRFSKDTEYYKEKSIYPNQTLDKKNKIFENYAFLLLAMNGQHALRPHNRKYYFNSFTQLFEPIYYDGNLRVDLGRLDIIKPPNKDIKLILNSLSINEIHKNLTSIQSLGQDADFLQKLKKRINLSTPDTQNLINKLIKNIEINIKELLEIKNEIDKNQNFLFPKVNNKSNILDFLKRKKELGLNFRTIELSSSDKNLEITYLDDIIVKTRKLKNPKIISKLISKNILNKKRTVLLNSSANNQISQINSIKLLEGILLYSNKDTVNIDFDNKEIIFLQKNPSDWLLIKDVFLQGWTIKMTGRLAKPDNQLEQRFNQYGLTGCLNFYNVKFSKVNILAANGQCEDTLNLVASRGIIENININNSYADAVDIDFSKLEFKNIETSKSGNDCIDVSGGHYTIQNAILNNCADKGLSVGEMSEFLAFNVSITNSSIAISSKDSSVTKINKLQTENTKTCIEAFNKKQEFNGSIIAVLKMSCFGNINYDKNSIIKINGKKQ